MINTEKIFHSQCGQDKFLYKNFFKNYNKPGIFIELGAFDGIKISNSYFFEKYLGWNGVCIEPTEYYYKKLVKNRKCFTFNNVIYDEIKDIVFYNNPECCHGLNGIEETYDKKHINRIHREINYYNNNINNIKKEIKRTRKMESILNEVNLNEIDFLSLDTEGSELNILKSINWDKTKIKVICVEDNYGDNKLHNYLKKLNYKYFNKLSSDYIYYKEDLIKPIN